jgi:regulator of ribonuclease activity A
MKFMYVSTADLCDFAPDQCRVADPIFHAFGGKPGFSGRIVTVTAPEDNSLVRASLEEPGVGKVLVVDGGGSYRCALLGDRLGLLAVQNGWNGVIVHGCVRDSAALAKLHLGVCALGTSPRKSKKEGRGERDVVLYFAAVAWKPGEYVYVDEDGIVLAAEPLHEKLPGR